MKVVGKYLDLQRQGRGNTYMENGVTKLTLHLGSCANVNAMILSDFDRLDNVEKEVVPCTAIGNEISGTYLEVNGHVVAEGCKNVLAWLDKNHQTRVTRRHTRQLRQSTQPKVPAYAWPGGIQRLQNLYGNGVVFCFSGLINFQ